MNNFASLAQFFDTQVLSYVRRKSERSLGFRLRKKLLKGLSGEILECACGTGVNFQFYDKDAHITAVDISSDMIDKARKKAHEHKIGNIQYITSSIEDVILTPHTYDNVVSTLSLCTYANPVEVLRKFGKWCKPNGRILLLEHGMSSSSLLARIQHFINPWHYKKKGCHYNRNIQEIVRLSDLEIVDSERHIFGIVHLIRCKPRHV
jgi:ubiquinone/menaquinone biosynthesis C-methylase UbiE